MARVCLVGRMGGEGEASLRIGGEVVLVGVGYAGDDGEGGWVGGHAGGLRMWRS